MSTIRKPTKPKSLTATTESPAPTRGGVKKASGGEQLELELIPVPPDADRRVMELLYTLAMKGNLNAAKLFLDNFRSDPDDEPQLSPEDAMKLVQEHLKNAA